MASDELTAELRRVYEQAESAAWVALPLMGRPEDLNDAQIVKTAALLAVARHSAERQRGMEATEKMMSHGCYAVKAIYAKEGGWCGLEAAKDQVITTYIALQSAAPLWVDKK